MAVRTEEILEKWLIVNELTLSDGSKVTHNRHPGHFDGG